MVESLADIPVSPSHRHPISGEAIWDEAAVRKLMAAPQPPSAPDEREAVQCKRPGGTKSAALHAPNCPVRLRDAVLIDPYDGGTWLAPSPGVDAAEQKPDAWLVPSILTFVGAERTNCPPELQAEFEGQVKWRPSIIGDTPPVVDKFGVTHRPLPLYAAPSPAASADEWKAAVDNELVTLQSTADSYDTPAKAVKALIDWHVSVAKDPAVNGANEWLAEAVRLAKDLRNKSMAAGWGKTNDEPADDAYAALLAHLKARP